MASLVFLPTPQSASAFALGQLLSNPLEPSSPSFSTSTTPATTEPQVQPHYKDAISHDDEGRFISSLVGHSLSSHNSVVLVQADEMEYTSLKSSTRAFDAIRQDTATQAYLRKLALRDQPLYYVVGLQKLRNPSFKRAVVREGSLAEAKSDIRLPMHVRRDSAMDLGEDTNDAIVGVELRKVRCHVGSADAPHSIEDIDYSWSYHKLDSDDDLQLSIGLGKVLEAAEMRALAGIVSDDDFTDHSYYEFDDSDDEGQAGF